MLLLPIDRPIDWHNPPIVTFLLVLVNCLFYFVWQHDDHRYAQMAYEQYEASGLLEMELKRYYQYRGLTTANNQLTLDLTKEKTFRDAQEMNQDAAFQLKLAHEQIITPNDPVYAQWKQHRTQYDTLMNLVVTQKYGLNPAIPSIVTFFTSMFLHANFMHLFGNMLSLLLMGYVVETILGRAIYFWGYLVAGLLGNALYVLLMSNTYQSGIGASGAVFSVLGMYVVLFGLRKIRFFFFFIYFNYFKAPAIIMLFPIIAYQLYIQFYLKTNINVLVHLGGLAGGALVALIAKRFLSKDSTDYLNQEIDKEKYQQAYNLGQQQLAAMNYKDAKATFTKLVSENPNDIGIKQQLFHIVKLTPDSEDFHQLAQQLLKLPGADRASVRIVHDVFIEYSSRAKPKPQLSADLLITLALRFAAGNYLADAEKIMNYLIHAKPDFSRNAEGLSALAKYYNGKDQEKAGHYRQLLLQTYPDSTQAQHLKRVST
jgi:membrane associated rhomboid family serine protease